MSSPPTSSSKGAAAAAFRAQGSSLPFSIEQILASPIKANSLAAVDQFTGLEDPAARQLADLMAASQPAQLMAANQLLGPLPIASVNDNSHNILPYLMSYMLSSIQQQQQQQQQHHQQQGTDNSPAGQQRLLGLLTTPDRLKSSNQHHLNKQQQSNYVQQQLIAVAQQQVQTAGDLQNPLLSCLTACMQTQRQPPRHHLQMPPDHQMHQSSPAEQASSFRPLRFRSEGADCLAGQQQLPTQKQSVDYTECNLNDSGSDSNSMIATSPRPQQHSATGSLSTIYNSQAQDQHGVSLVSTNSLTNNMNQQQRTHNPATLSFLPGSTAFPWTVAARGKPRRGMMRRAVFSDSQRVGLEKRFQVQKYISKPDRKKLAEKLGLRDSQVKIWFQNRRMKWRNSKERELLSAGGSREQTLPTRNNPNPDLSDVGETIKRLTAVNGTTNNNSDRSVSTNNNNNNDNNK